MSRASWSKLGGGRLRRDCPELELARELWDWGRATGFRPQEKGRGVLLDCACGRRRRVLAGLPEVKCCRLEGPAHRLGAAEKLQESRHF